MTDISTRRFRIRSSPFGDGYDVTNNNYGPITKRLRDDQLPTFSQMAAMTEDQFNAAVEEAWCDTP